MILSGTGDIARRFELGSAFLPAVPPTALIYFCPESPRWLMKKGRYHDAYKSFKRLRNSELQPARDMYYVHRQLEEEFAVLKGTSYFTRFFELLTIPCVRRAILASFVVMIVPQMRGINIIAFYSSSMLVGAGYTSKQALLASWGFGLVKRLLAFPAVWVRKPFISEPFFFAQYSLYVPRLLIPLAVETYFFSPSPTCHGPCSPLVAASCFWIPSDNSARVPLIALFVFLFAVFYSPGEGPVPFTYSAEVFPLTHREMGMSWAVATCFFWVTILGVTFPRIIATFTPQGGKRWSRFVLLPKIELVFFFKAFGFYAGLNLIALIMIYFLMPETMQRTLEGLDYVFAVPTSKHISYQAKTFLSYYIKQYVFFRKNKKL
jgi:hypothetical protein